MLALLVCTALMSGACGPLMRSTAQRYVQLDTVLFATDRAPANDGFYGGERDTLQYGFAEVEFEYYLPGAWPPEGQPLDRRAQKMMDRTQRIRLRNVTPVSESAFFHMVREGSATARVRHRDTTALLFVHGFNNSFAQAIERTANLQHHTSIHPAIAYTWPSRSGVLQYVTDLEQAQWTAPHLTGFLARLQGAVEARHVNIVVHSMGAQVLGHALARAGLRVPADSMRLGEGRFRSITFVNPDYDEQLFMRDALPMFRAAARRLTLYGTPRDLPLRLASFLRSRYPRAGQVNTGTMECPSGLDCVDVTPALTGAGLHHFDVLAPNSTLAMDFAQAVLAANPGECRAAQNAYDRQGTVWVMRRRPTFDPAKIPEACLGYGPAHQIVVQGRGTQPDAAAKIHHVFSEETGSAEIQDEGLLVRSHPMRVGEWYVRFDAVLVPSSTGFQIRMLAGAANRPEAFDNSLAEYYIIEDATEWQEQWQVLRRMTGRVEQALVGAENSAPGAETP